MIIALYFIGGAANMMCSVVCARHVYRSSGNPFFALATFFAFSLAALRLMEQAA